MLMPQIGFYKKQCAKHLFLDQVKLSHFMFYRSLNSISLKLGFERILT